MKKVIMIAHQFPPAGGPGVQRTSKFVKYLNKFGYESIVITRSDKNMPLGDETLLKDIPKKTRIYRLPAYDVSKYSGIVGKFFRYAARKVMIPDTERLWQFLGNKKMLDILNNEGAKLIYTTSMPYSSHLAGLYIKEKRPDIKWVADFRDEWIRNPYILDDPYCKVRMNIEEKMEKKVLNKADGLIANTPVMLDNFIKYNNEINLKDKFFVIPNGFDEEDFSKNDNVVENDRFTLTYTGSFYGRRKPDTFIEGLSLAIKKKLINKEKILVQFVGNYKKSSLKSLVEKYDMQNIFSISGYVPHEKCVQMMQNSNCLLLIEATGPGSEAFYTGKVFEYMAAKTPIIGIIPKPGAAAKLIEETNTGLVANYNDIEIIANNIGRLYSAWENKEEILNINIEEVNKYKRKNLTKQLSSVFDYVLSK